jgi:hypothetical protein
MTPIASLDFSSVTRDLIHRRCGHLHEGRLIKLDKFEVGGISPFPKVQNMNMGTTRDRDPLAPFHIVALDIWGPTSTADIGGNIWFIGVVCYD